MWCTTCLPYTMNKDNLGIGMDTTTGTPVPPKFYSAPELSQNNMLNSILEHYYEEIVPAQESINELVLKNRKIPKEKQDKYFTESIESYYREL